MSKSRKIYVQDASTLYTYDPRSGEFATIGSTGVTLTDIAAVDSNRLYGVSFTGLYEVNPGTGSTSLIGSFGRSDMNGLGVDQNGQLYASGNGTRTIFKVNALTAQLTPFATASANSAGDIVILNDRLWMATTARTLESFSLTDGSMISSLNHGISSVFGLAVSSEGELIGFANDLAYTFDLGTGQATLRAQFPIDQQVFGAAQAASTFENLFSGSSASDSLSGTQSDDAVSGLDGDDQLFGLGGSDFIIGGQGNDLIDGGQGIDTANYESILRSALSLTKTQSGFTAFSSQTGTDQLLNVERLQFADVGLALDLDGNAGITAKLIGAVFGAALLNNRTYVQIGLSELDRGVSYLDLAQLAIDARLGSGADNATVVRTLYTNVAGFGPSQSDLESFVSLLEDGTFTKASLTQFAAEHQANLANINLVGLSQTGIEFELI